MARFFKLTIEYDGSDFVGWQIQPNGPTIQAAIERAFYQITGETVRVVGSGRTDAGVHARGQVASCCVESWSSEAHVLVRALNAHLPDSISIMKVEDAPQGFHAIRDAVSKRYRYQIYLGRPRDVFENRYRWYLHGQIDLDVMQEACGRFVGKHDFASFQASGATLKKTTVRTISACDLVVEKRVEDRGLYFSIEIEADGFLYNMVRNIVGTLIEIGRGKQSPKWIDELFVACDRTQAGPTAPAHGLFLLRVHY